MDAFVNPAVPMLLEKKEGGKRGPKAPPRSKPGKWDKPERQAHATKKGPGRKCAKHHNADALRTMVAPEPRKPLFANVGGHHPLYETRRVWREGEPMHIVKPVRHARKRAAPVAATVRGSQQ